MKVLSVLALMAALAATDAAAQGVDLTGQFRCVAMCAPGLQGQPAFVTQNGSNSEPAQRSRRTLARLGRLERPHLGRQLA